MNLENKKKATAENIIDLLKDNYPSVVKEFYEMQSGFLSTRYKIHKSIETSTIVICLIKNIHLEIIRQREKNLDYNFSLNNFLKNLDSINLPAQKIISIVGITGIPKETVRRKIKKLALKEYVRMNRNKEYYWHLTPKRSEYFMYLMEKDIKFISKYILGITKLLNLDLTQKKIEEEIKSQFSFYFYHFLSSQLSWLKMWQTNLKDIDLVFITIQALIPTLNYVEKLPLKVSLDELHKELGKMNQTKSITSNNTISATSISEISGIPRATCIRKLEKLVNLGLLVREIKSKRYYVNQHASDRTKNILRKENIDHTVKTFGQFLSIVITALLRNKK